MASLFVLSVRILPQPMPSASTYSRAQEYRDRENKVISRTRNEKKQIFVCCIPVAEELDLKKAAKHLGSKSIEMLSVKELLPTVGYVRGSCSPIGMKKRFRTVIHESALTFEKIAFSAGKRGMQVEMKPEELIKFIGAETADITI